MKLLNFRPLAVIALLAILTAWSCLVSPWATVGLALALGLVLILSKTPLLFKVVLVTVYLVVIASFLLHTAFNPEPVYRTYDANAGLRGVVLRYANGRLHRYLSDDNAELLFSIMFGNKSGLPWWLRQDFSVAGVAHLLAVSGLHVGLLAVVLVWLLKVMRVPRRARVYCLAPLLLFYAYLCGWQYAILRAVIMCLVYEIARNYQRTADPLTALSIAVTLILILFPYALRAASFILSFACVFGIILFYQSLLKIVRWKMLAMYLAVTIGSLPFVIYCFGYVAIYGVITNLVLVPVLILSFYVGMLAVSTYLMGWLLWLMEPLLTLCRRLCTVIAALPGAALPIAGSVPAIGLYLVGLFLLSRFVFLPKRVKYPLGAVLIACYFVTLVV